MPKDTITPRTQEERDLLEQQRSKAAEMLGIESESARAALALAEKEVEFAKSKARAIMEKHTLEHGDDFFKHSGVRFAVIAVLSFTTVVLGIIAYFALDNSEKIAKDKTKSEHIKGLEASISATDKLHAALQEENTLEIIRNRDKVQDLKGEQQHLSALQQNAAKIEGKTKALVASNSPKDFAKNFRDLVSSRYQISLSNDATKQITNIMLNYNINSMSGTDRRAFIATLLGNIEDFLGKDTYDAGKGLTIAAEPIEQAFTRALTDESVPKSERGVKKDELFRIANDVTAANAAATIATTEIRTFATALATEIMTMTPKPEFTTAEIADATTALMAHCAENIVMGTNTNTRIREVILKNMHLVLGDTKQKLPDLIEKMKSEIAQPLAIATVQSRRTVFGAVRVHANTLALDLSTANNFAPDQNGAAGDGVCSIKLCGQEIHVREADNLLLDAGDNKLDAAGALAAWADGAVINADTKLDVSELVIQAMNKNRVDHLHIRPFNDTELKGLRDILGKNVVNLHPAGGALNAAAAGAAITSAVTQCKTKLTEQMRTNENNIAKEASKAKPKAGDKITAVTTEKDLAALAVAQAEATRIGIA